MDKSVITLLLHGSGFVIVAVSLLLAAWNAQWTLLRVGTHQHLFFGSALACLLLWQTGFGPAPVADWHMLGVSTVVLLLGWRLTVVLLLPLFVLQALLSGWPWGESIIASIAAVLLPATITRGLVYWLRRRFGANLFFYTLGAGFSGGILSQLLFVGLGSLLVNLGIGERLFYLPEGMWPLLPMLAFAEGFVNGMLAAAFAVFAPQMLKTFDDRYYIDGK